MQFAMKWAMSCGLFLFWIPTSSAAEIRKYEFNGEVPAYYFSCGECSGPPHSVRARVEGTFEVDLDFEQGIGTLLSLDARLAGAEGLFGENNWQSVAWQSDFFYPGILYDRYRPPFSGTLMPADFRPLGPGTLTPEHRAPYIGVPTSEIPDTIAYWMSNRIGFEPAPEDSWILSFDGAVRNPDGTVFYAATYIIYFEGNDASLTYNVPVDDALPSIRAAGAQLVPEPSGFVIACVGLVCFGVRKFVSDRN